MSDFSSVRTVATSDFVASVSTSTAAASCSAASRTASVMASAWAGVRSASVRVRATAWVSNIRPSPYHGPAAGRNRAAGARRQRVRPRALSRPGDRKRKLLRLTAVFPGLSTGTPANGTRPPRTPNAARPAGRRSRCSSMGWKTSMFTGVFPTSASQVLPQRRIRTDASGRERKRTPRESRRPAAPSRGRSRQRGRLSRNGRRGRGAADGRTPPSTARRRMAIARPVRSCRRPGCAALPFRSIASSARRPHDSCWRTRHPARLVLLPLEVRSRGIPLPARLVQRGLDHAPGAFGIPLFRTTRPRHPCPPRRSPPVSTRLYTPLIVLQYHHVYNTLCTHSPFRSCQDSRHCMCTIHCSGRPWYCSPHATRTPYGRSLVRQIYSVRLR